MPAQAQPPEHLYTYHELTGLFQVHYSTVYRWFRNRARFRHRGSVRIANSEVQKFIAEKTTTTPTTKPR